MSNELTWDDTGKIGVRLCDTHPKTEPHTVALSEVHGYVTALSEFKGDPKNINEQTLEAIRDAWNTEFLERTRNWS